MMLRALVLAVLMAAPALAGGSLSGHLVTFYVLTYDDPEAPLFRGEGKTVRVGEGIEFGLLPEGAQNDLDVVPVLVNLGPQRIELSYEIAPEDLLVPAVFNGYVLEFPVNCVLITEARLDRAATTMPLAPDALQIVGRSLRINVQNLDVRRDGRIAIDLEVEDCPMS